MKQHFFKLMKECDNQGFYIYQGCPLSIYKKIASLCIHMCLCIAKETTDKMKRQSMEWEKIPANHISDKELIIKI